MMDRVPLYLEIDAVNMPHPCKILLRPNYKRFGYSEEVLKLIAQHTYIYVSTKTKNPSKRNHQLAIGPPGKRVFSFSPIVDNGPRDMFADKIYLGIYYDLSEGESKEEDGSKEDNAGLDNKDIGDEMSHIEMIMHVSFPKDKEELKRKKLEAMMKKINADG